MFNFHSIKFRIVALGICLAFVGLMVREFVVLPRVQAHAAETAETQQMAIASYIARDIDQEIRSRTALIEQLASALPEELARNPSKLQSWLRNHQHINPAFSGGMLAVRADGHGLVAEYPAVSGRSALDYAAMDWFSAAVRAGKTIVAKPTRTPLSNDPALIFAAPVRDADGKVVTVLAGIVPIDAAGFLDRIRETQLGNHGGISLVAPSERVYIVSAAPRASLQPVAKPGLNPLLDRAMSGYRGSVVNANAEGIDELASVVTVPSTGWFVFAHLPTAEALRPALTARGFSSSIGLAVPIILALILLYGLTRILRPLTETAQAIRAMADGQRELAPLPLVRNDEVGKVVGGFNVLVERLHAEGAARQASEARLTFMAHHDSLTGLCNRAMLEDRLQQELARTERDGTQIALLFCDLDGFKPINDRFGHEVGDEVLRQVATRLTDGRRRVDTVARLGGDEFVILLTALTDARAGASVVAQQCLAAIAEPIHVQGHTITLGMSIGIALHAGTAVTPSYLIAKADVAMYQVKRKGKGGYFFMEEIGMLSDEPSAIA